MINIKKEYTPFGKYFSNLRKEKKQSITEAAEMLDVSIAYISAVEHGDREIPSSWISRITQLYELDEEEIALLKKSYFDTPSFKKVSLYEIEDCLTNMILNTVGDDNQKEKLLKELKERLENFRK